MPFTWGSGGGSDRFEVEMDRHGWWYFHGSGGGQGAATTTAALGGAKKGDTGSSGLKAARLDRSDWVKVGR
jgi:hypothetical protein